MTTPPDPRWPRASEWLAAGADDPAFTVIGVPHSAGSISPSEAWRTPKAVRAVLERLSTFDGESGRDLRDLPVADAGDWDITNLDPAAFVAAAGAAAATLPTGPVYAFVGGDNLLTWPVAASLPHTPIARTGLLTLDAHHDVREMPDGPINGGPVRGLIDAGLPGDQIVQIGIHSFANSLVDRRWAEQQGVTVRTLPEVDAAGIEQVIRGALDDLASRVDAIHVDFDLDVLDRSFAPACPGARPGGLTPRQLFAAARIAGACPAVVSADFVEVDATRDVADVTLMNLGTTLLAFASGVLARTS